MAAGAGQFIEASDYNSIRAKIAEVMAVGSASYGYGQNLISDTVEYAPPIGIPTETPEQKAKRRITKAQWDALRFDLINARVHQLDTVPVLTEVSTTDPIRYGASHPNSQYNTIIYEAMGGKGDNDYEKDTKIIKKIAKNVTIDKNI
jgi:hypothetical protein